MGRRAKYHTREERLSARRQQRMQREAEPGAKDVRRAQGRRAWQKKRDLGLLRRESPSISDTVKEEASKEISRPDYARTYNQFLEGRDSLSFDEVDVEEEDLKMMIGTPPYSNVMETVSGFPEKWPVIAAALHGMMVREHIAYSDQLILRTRTLPQVHILSGLDARYHELVVKYNEIDIAMRQSQAPSDSPATYIARLNKRWTAQQIVETVGDMDILKEGCEKFMRAILDRKWEIGSRRHEACWEAF